MAATRTTKSIRPSQLVQIIPARFVRAKAVVELDETLVGGEKPGKRGRGAEGKTLVLIAVEDKGEFGIGRIRLGQVPDASGKSLLKFVEDNIDHGSTVRTDGWTGYNALSRIGYEHHREKQTENVGEDALPLVHQVAGLLKRWLEGIYQGAVRHHQLAYYLDEYTFRFNRRTSASRGKLFYRLVQQAMITDPVPAHEIVGGVGSSTSPGKTAEASDGDFAF